MKMDVTVQAKPSILGNPQNLRAQAVASDGHMQF